MMLQAFSAGTMFSSAMVFAPADAVSSETAASFESSIESNSIETSVPNCQANPGPLEVRANSVDVDRWSAEHNARFKELARREALEELSIEELAELERLTNLRRFEKYPRSADEILWQRRQQKLTRGLVDALQAYVEFHQPTRRP